ncbi:M14 family metallopeptidase [Aquibacillus albus]|uniref:G-D-glutamyl-meso-diaminopimelate peptidase n=1 Tax=Aquibacillus albus TaxID=1168171 RepID=A0ABS2MYT2_9BACI|nr:M14 family metallocarboxypeptidase [Aquibacillus albus]MBM7571004.1 g-D-glutamyl-meso-diaminopimelate peptidase [Aquibacillus albus]
MDRIVNPKQVYTYEQLVKDITKLKQKFPDLIQVEVIGHSIENRKLYALKLGKGDREIFINGAHHAREWLTTALLMVMVETYSEAFKNNQKIGGFDVKEILSKTSIWFVPMVNPDGVALVQNGEQTMSNANQLLELNNGSKDFSSWKANIHGVDLNRQYPADWENIQNDPGKPASAMYKGPSPLSEPETKSIYDFTIAHNFELAVAYHSSGEEIFWKYRSNGDLLRQSKKIADMISKKTGYSLIFPGPNPSGGGFTDWFLDSLKKPGFTIEISPLVGPRPVPISFFDKIWNENKEVGIMLAKEAVNPF